MGVKNSPGNTRRLAMYVGALYLGGGFIPLLSDGVRLILFKCLISARFGARERSDPIHS